MLKNALKIMFALSFCVCLGANTFSEDSYLMISSDAFNRGDYATAKDGYLTLYEQTKNINYAKEAALSAANMGDFKTAFKLALLYQDKTKNTKDVPTNKILADSYIRMGDIKKAIFLLEAIKEQENSLAVDKVLGTLYLSQKDLDKAFPLLDEFYNSTHDEETLGKLVAIYLAKNDSKKGLELLKSHLIKYGCTDDFCQKSLNTFVEFNDIQDAKEAFEKMYQKSPTIDYAKYYIWILTSLKDYKQAQKIAEAFPLNRHLLLDLYVAQKDFATAAKQASLIYKENKDPKYLALEAVYLYESMGKPDKSKIEKILKLFEKALNERKKEVASTKEELNYQDAFFYNFLGYMLIDYGVDVKKGIGYVKTALEIDPGSISYVDSLAWGYYKLGNCAEAKKIFAAIPKDEIEAEPELKNHFQSIQNCQK